MTLEIRPYCDFNMNSSNLSDVSLRWIFPSACKDVYYELIYHNTSIPLFKTVAVSFVTESMVQNIAMER